MDAPNGNPPKWIDTVISYWKLVALVAAATAWLVTWNGRVTAHEDLTADHIKRDKEIVRLLREICRKLPGANTSCNLHEDE